MAPGGAQAGGKIAGRIARVQQVTPGRLDGVAEGPLAEEVHDGWDVKTALDDVAVVIGAVDERGHTLYERATGSTLAPSYRVYGWMRCYRPSSRRP